MICLLKIFHLLEEAELQRGFPCAGCLELRATAGVTPDQVRSLKLHLGLSSFTQAIFLYFLQCLSRALDWNWSSCSTNWHKWHACVTGSGLTHNPLRYNINRNFKGFKYMMTLEDPPITYWIQWHETRIKCIISQAIPLKIVVDYIAVF